MNDEKNFISLLEEYKEIISREKYLEKNTKTSKEKLDEINDNVEKLRADLAKAATLEDRDKIQKQLKTEDFQNQTEEIIANKEEYDRKADARKEELKGIRDKKEEIIKSSEEYYEKKKTEIENRKEEIEKQKEKIENQKKEIEEKINELSKITPKGKEIEAVINNAKQVLKSLDSQINELNNKANALTGKMNTLNAHKKVFEFGIKKLNNLNISEDEIINKSIEIEDNEKKKGIEEKDADYYLKEAEKALEKDSKHYYLKEAEKALENDAIIERLNKRYDKYTNNKILSKDTTVAEEKSTDIEENVVNEKEKSINIEESIYNKQYKTNKKIHILVNENGYIIDDELVKPDYKLLKKKQKNEKEIYGKDYNEIMSKINRKSKKYYDPILLKILYEKYGKNTSMQYLEELSKGKNANKNDLPYEIVYDEKNIKRNKKMNKIAKIAEKNKYVATVIEEKNKKGLKVAIAGLLAAGVGLVSNGANIDQLQKNDKEINPTNEYVDSNIPDINYNMEDENETNKETDDKNEFQESIKVQVEENATTDYAQEKIDNLLNQLEDFKLGNMVVLNEGVNYTENSLGEGKSGTVGEVQWRPSGTYIVNGVSIINPSNNEIINYTFGKDSNGNIDENFDLYEYLKENLEKGMEVKFHIDKDGTKPTGWIDSSYVISALEKSQENSDNQISESIDQTR